MCLRGPSGNMCLSPLYTFNIIDNNYETFAIYWQCTFGCSINETDHSILSLHQCIEYNTIENVNGFQKKRFIRNKFQSVSEKFPSTDNFSIFPTIDYAFLHSFLPFLHHGFLILLCRNGPERLLNSSPNFCIHRKPHAHKATVLLAKLCIFAYIRVEYLVHSHFAYLRVSKTSRVGTCGTLCCLLIGC